MTLYVCVNIATLVLFYIKINVYDKLYNVLWYISRFLILCLMLYNIIHQSSIKEV